MYKGNNPSALRSRDLIVKAMFQLLEKQSYSDISIKELTDTAQLSRQTFYAIFSNREEIIECQLQMIFVEFQTALAHSPGTKHHLITLFFEFYQKHAAIINKLIDNNLESILTETARNCMVQLNLSNNKEKNYIYGFVAAGLTQLIADRHRNNEDISIEQLIYLTEELLTLDN